MIHLLALEAELQLGPMAMNRLRHDIVREPPGGMRFNHRLQGWTAFEPARPMAVAGGFVRSLRTRLGGGAAYDQPALVGSQTASKCRRPAPLRRTASCRSSRAASYPTRAPTIPLSDPDPVNEPESEPMPRRFLILADRLQTEGDPRGASLSMNQ